MWNGFALASSEADRFKTNQPREQTGESKLAMLKALSFLWPRPVLSGSYQARCARQRDCAVRIVADRMGVDGKPIPVDAPASWAKGGPGSQPNPVPGSGAIILLGSPDLLAFGIRSFKSTVSMAYFSLQGKIQVVASAI
jgi:hypothetical protein